jgi:hypothetical protein
MSVWLTVTVLLFTTGLRARMWMVSPERGYVRCAVQLMSVLTVGQC